MIKTITSLITCFIIFSVFIKAEEINLSSTYNDVVLQKYFTAASEATINDQLEYNLDSNSVLIDSMHFTSAFLNLIKSLQIQDYRFPGGTIGNYYHFFSNGHGIDTLDFDCRPRQGFVYNQLPFDQFFDKNLMHYFVEFMHYMQNQTTEEKGVYYHLNIQKHINRKQLIATNPFINATFNNLFDSATINQPVTNFSPTDLDFYISKLSTIKRNGFTNNIKTYLANDSAFKYYFLENIASINFLVENNIKVKGIELGNETQAEYLLYDDDLSLLGFDCNNIPDTIEVNGFDNLRLRDYLEGIYKFWIITSMYADFIKTAYAIPTGVPASLHYAYLIVGNDNTYQIRDNFGRAEREAQLWNRFLANDTTYDAMIPHFYTQRFIPCENYDSTLNSVSLDELYNYSLDFLKKSASLLFNHQMTELIDDIGNKRIWLTEWNLNGNTYMNNTFMHSYFLQQLFLNAISIQEQNLFNIDTWIIHNLASSSYVFALVQSASRGNGHHYKKFLGASIYEMWNTTLNHHVKRINYNWNNYFNINNTFIDINGFINATQDSLIFHFANPTNDSVLLNISNLTFLNSDSSFSGHVVSEFVLNANSWQSNNTACYLLSNDTLDKNYTILNQTIEAKQTYTIPNFSIGKITVALQKEISTNLSNNLKNIKLKVYPSVTNSILNIILNNTTNTNYKYKIIDLQGKIIDEFYNNTSSFSINTQDYKNGMYIISVEDKNLTTNNIKFVVQH